MHKEVLIRQLGDKYKIDPTTQATAFWKLRDWIRNEHAEVTEQRVVLGNNLLWCSSDTLPSIDEIEKNDYDAMCLETPLRIEGYQETKYFKLYHDLKSLEEIDAEDIIIEEVREDELEEVVDFINASYEHINVHIDQVKSWLKLEVYRNRLWIWLKQDTHKVALGIAEIDRELREGALEWIQVKSEYRGQSFGKKLVNELLKRMKDEVDFVTVSGELDQVSDPEKLYRACGFMGNKTYYVYKK